MAPVTSRPMVEPGMTTQNDLIAQARARLLAEREEVLRDVATLRDRLEAKGDYGLGEGDPMIYQWELNLALLERAEQRLAEIEDALQQLEMGAYGVCERCGNPIEPERLALLPHTTLCSQCAQRQR
jgi:RNA polymerase-binding transcription factor DksA